MNKPTLTLSLVCSGLFLASAATAADANILYASASQYQNAVTKLDQALSRSREIRGADRSLVNRLELAAKRMVSAAKNPRHLNRLRFEWKRVVPLQQQVEQGLFEKYSPNLELVRTWEYLLWTQAVFEEEFAFYLEDPRRGRSIRRRISSSQPNRYLPLPPTSQFTPAVVPAGAVLKP